MKLSKFLILITVIVTVTNYVLPQSYQEKFNQYFNENDTLNQRLTLEEWEKIEPKDPELFAAYLNYHLFKAQNNFIVVSQDKIDSLALRLTDSLNQTAGDLNNQTEIKMKELQKGIDKIDKGIALYPDRLDMRFGKMYILGMIEDWNKLADEIVNSVEYSSANNNNWTWKNNEELENGEEILLKNIQDYQVQLFNTGKDSLLLIMQNIALEVLKFYPDNIENITNLAITYLISKDYDKGLELLLKAEKLNPADMVVVSNIANCYFNKGDYANAILYYQKMIDSGDSNAAEIGQREIDKLKGKAQKD